MQSMVTILYSIFLFEKIKEDNLLRILCASIFLLLYFLIACLTSMYSLVECHSLMCTLSFSNGTFDLTTDLDYSHIERSRFAPSKSALCISRARQRTRRTESRWCNSDIWKISDATARSKIFADIDENAFAHVKVHI